MTKNLLLAFKIARLLNNPYIQASMTLIEDPRALKRDIDLSYQDLGRAIMGTVRETRNTQ